MLSRLAELAALFTKLGSISFGGPMAHIALMEEEVVRRRQWLTHGEFIDLLGVTNLIPGPNATEMAAHIGHRRAGLLGSIVAGACFTIPAVLISLALAWAYVRYGRLPQAGWLLAGIKPVVLAIVFSAVLRFGQKTLRKWQAIVVALGVALSAAMGSDEVATLLAGAAAGFLLIRLTSPGGKDAGKTPPQLPAASACLAAPMAWLVPTAAAPAALSLSALGLFFLKVGAVMYGTGYVLIAYLDGGLVGKYPGFGRVELLDAVAAGQLTPGPLLSTATFIGYLLAGPGGAIVATVCVFLPSFVFVAASHPLIPHLRRWKATGQFLDAVNAASVGLMAAVGLTLGRQALADWTSVLVALLAAALLQWRQTSPALLVAAGALAGWLLW